ncbi:MAG TPA: RidA family protein [Zeimonas sp.]|nr:RidA family protein [Zeimonas sp.]
MSDDIVRLQTGPRLSQAVRHGGTVYLAGQVAEDVSLDVSGQTRQVLATIDRLLAEAGSDRTRILQATVYLTDIADFAAMNEVWDAWIPAGHTPARATVEAKLAAPGCRVEIQLIAALADG